MPRADVTEDYIHVRVRDPKKCDFVRYAKRGAGVEVLSKKGIRLKVCCPKGQATARNRCKTGMVTQAIVCDRDEYTKSQCIKKARGFRK